MPQEAFLKFLKELQKFAEDFNLQDKSFEEVMNQYHSMNCTMCIE